MPTEVKLPELGDGIESGDVLEVLVAEGDQIEKEQGVVELETDKATVEVPSTHAGKVVKVHVSEGDTVPIGGVLISVEQTAAATPPPVETSGPAQPAAPPAPAASTTEAPPPAAPVEPAGTTPSPPAEPVPPAQPQPQPKPAQPKPAQPKPAQLQPIQPQPVAELAEARGTIPAGPAVRRFAREVGVDLSRVQGSGPGGRITRDDVLGVVRQANQVARTGGKPTAVAAAGDSETDDWGPIRVEKMSRIRRAIATQMHESWKTVPRVTNFDDADVTELEQFRQASKADYAEQGIKLTSMPFLIKSVAMALRSHPAINAAVDLENQQITYKDYVNIGIAVDTERGLVVPALRRADQLSIPEIARELATLASKARESSFSLEDLRGGTFTISNLGAIGGTYSTPIVNVPEVAILLVGRSRKMPVVVDDQIVVRLMMPLSLSYDHRLVDGATAARFLNEVIGFLKAPSRLLLAP